MIRCQFRPFIFISAEQCSLVGLRYFGFPQGRAQVGQVRFSALSQVVVGRDERGEFRRRKFEPFHLLVEIGNRRCQQRLLTAVEHPVGKLRSAGERGVCGNPNGRTKGPKFKLQSPMSKVAPASWTAPVLWRFGFYTVRPRRSTNQWSNEKRQKTGAVQNAGATLDLRLWTLGFGLWTFIVS